MIAIPIRLRQAPNFVAQVLKRFLVLRRAPPVQRTFHLCFFSCKSYFSYLYCSLHSLIKHAAGIKFKVLVFNDSEQPLSATQTNALSKLLPDVRVIDWPKSMGWGEAQIGWIWKAYALAAEGAAENDIIARVDSDVFFFNDRIFQAVLRSDADLVGDGHFVDFRYCQGGCYFLRAGAVNQINEMLRTEGLGELLAAENITVEDIAAHYFAQRLGLKIWLTWFMMFPDELRNAGGLSVWQRWKFSCLHFVMKNKAAMLEAYEREVFQGQVPPAYSKAIRTP